MRRGAAQLITLAGVSAIFTLSACGFSFAGIAPPLPQPEIVGWISVIFAGIMGGLGLLTALHRLFFMPWLNAATSELKREQDKQNAAHREMIEATLREIGDGFAGLIDRHRSEPEPHPAISATERSILARLDSASQKLGELIKERENAERKRLEWGVEQ